jgi:curved DNA-binding protein CbpA
MEARGFVNYYEVLELSPSASAEAINRSFRYLARRYHPDNQATGDRSRFDAVLEAHDILKDIAKRAEYHEEHKHCLPPLRPSAGDESERIEADGGADGGDREAFVDGFGIERDVSIQNNLLTLLYFRRRRNIREPGMGDAELERLTGCPPEHLEFHLWYLKAKGWIAAGEDGLLAITIEGVDHAALIHRETAGRLLTDRS